MSLSYKSKLEHLKTNVGPACVMLLTEAEDPETIREWIHGHKEPSANQIDKICQAYEVFIKAWSARGAEAINWFTGAHLGNTIAPWRQIRDDQYDKAYAAADEFLRV